MLKPQDMLVLLKLRCLNERDRSVAGIIKSDVGLSTGEIYNCSRRLKSSGLVSGETSSSSKLKISARRVTNFLIHGVPSVYYPERGAVTTGMPTAGAVPYFDGKREPLDAASTLVWPVELVGGAEVDPRLSRGESLHPIYEAMPEAAARDEQLYELLAAVDSIRACVGRERKYAVDFIERRFAVTGSL